MLDDFIKEYEDNYLKVYKNEFYENLEKNCDILEEFNNKSLNKALKNLKFKKYDPINIGIIGEEKSLFINAFFKKNILPVGAIKNKIIYIKYAPLDMIRLIYLDNSYEFVEISKLYKIIEKNILNKILKIEIYLNNDVLKDFNFIYLPNESYIDQNIDILFFLSLDFNFSLKIDENIIKNSLFLLINKDSSKISEDEFKNFKNGLNFKDAIFISSKFRFENKRNSGFDQIFDFIKNIDKKEVINYQFLSIINSLIRSSDKFLNYFDELENLLNYPTNSLNINDFSRCFKQVEDYTLFLANELKDRIKTKDKFYYKEKEVLKFKYFKEYSYTTFKLEFDDKKFKERVNNSLEELSNEILKIKDKILEINNKNYNNFKDQILFFKSKYEFLPNENKLLPNFLYLEFLKVINSIYEKFLKDYDYLHLGINYKINLFFSEIKAKTIQKFKDISFIIPFKINEEILKSEEKYEQDPNRYCIYNPSIKEIQDIALNLLDLSKIESKEMLRIKNLLQTMDKDILRITRTQKRYVQELKSWHIKNIELFNSFTKDLL